MIEKTINGKTYARTGLPDGKVGMNSYFRKDGDDKYTLINDTSIDRNGNKYSKSQNYYGNTYPKEILESVEEYPNKAYMDGDRNPNSDANRKAYFTNDLGYKEDWAKDADNEDTLESIKEKIKVHPEYDTKDIMHEYIGSMFNMGYKPGEIIEKAREYEPLKHLSEDEILDFIDSYQRDTNWENNDNGLGLTDDEYERVKEDLDFGD